MPPRANLVCVTLFEIGCDQLDGRIIEIKNKRRLQDIIWIWNNYTIGTSGDPALRILYFIRKMDIIYICEQQTVSDGACSGSGLNQSKS